VRGRPAAEGPVTNLPSGSLFSWGDHAGRIVVKIGQDGTVVGSPCMQLHIVTASGETFVERRAYDVYDGDDILANTGGANSQPG